MKITISNFTNDLDDEFLKIRKNLEIHLKVDNDVQSKKSFMSSHVPREIIISSEVLFDTVMNALMTESRLILKEASTEVQNRFYDYDFRKRVKDWAMQKENKLSLEPQFIRYSRDPQLLRGLIAGGVTFTAGATVAGIAFIPAMLWKAIASGTATLILSAIAFKVAYDKAEPQALSQMTTDIENYLNAAKSRVHDWLGNVVTYFDKEFHSFCSDKNWEVK